MKNSKWKIIGVLGGILLIIIAFHGFYNLKEITTPPSKYWGRDIALGEITPLKKKPSIILTEKYANILTANKEHFIDIKVDRQTGTTVKRNIKINGAELGKLVKQEWSKDFIFWTENFTLFYSPRNNGDNFSEKILLADKVSDFTLYEAKSGLYLAVACDEGIKFFKGEGTALNPFTEDYKMEKAKGAAMIEDNSGLMHAVVYSSREDVEFPIHYLTLAQGQWQLQGEKNIKILSRSERVNSIDIGLDQTDAYIFYNLFKWDAFGVGAKTFFTRIPLKTLSPLPKTPQTMEFYRFTFDKSDDLDSGSSFINEPKIAKVQDIDLHFAVIRDDANRAVGDGFAVYLVTMDQSKIFKKAKATNTKKWLSNIDLKNIGNDYALTMLDLESGFKYQPFYTETGEAYKKVHEKGSAKDILYAFLNILPGYINSTLIILFKAFVLSPAFIWIILIEALEIRRFRDNEALTLSIGLAIYMTIKLFTMNTYYKESVLWLMPPILTFPNAEYFYGILTAAIAVLVTMMIKKSKPDMHFVLQFCIFYAIDLVLTALLYSQYII